jgi:hypothetical protein
MTSTRYFPAGVLIADEEKILQVEMEENGAGERGEGNGASDSRRMNSR